MGSYCGRAVLECCWQATPATLPIHSLHRPVVSISRQYILSVATRTVDDGSRVRYIPQSDWWREKRLSLLLIECKDVIICGLFSISKFKKNVAKGGCVYVYSAATWPPFWSVTRPWNNWLGGWYFIQIKLSWRIDTRKKNGWRLCSYYLKLFTNDILCCFRHVES